jgi:hypothetical protein
MTTVAPDMRALAVGTRLAHDGRWWKVGELDGPHVLLAGAPGPANQAGHLLADPLTRLLDAPGDPVEGVGAELAGRGEAELARLRERIARVEEVRTGSGAGAPSWPPTASRGRVRPWRPAAGPLCRWQFYLP